MKYKNQSADIYNFNQGIILANDIFQSLDLLFKVSTLVMYF